MDAEAEDERLKSELQSLFLHSDVLSCVESWLWRELVSAAGDRNHPWCFPSLSTVEKSSQGELIPSSRTVVLRHADPEWHSLDFYTDYRSTKMCSLLRNGLSGSVCWLFYRHGTQGQLRVDARYEVLRGEKSEAHWRETPDVSKGLYATLDPPGSPLNDSTGGRSDADLDKAHDNFCVVRTFVQRMDLVWLDSSGNRRLQLDYPSDTSKGCVRWLVP